MTRTALTVPPASRKTTQSPSILIISPVKDEAEYLQRTIDSMVAQTLRPALWVIVDDGSTDDTGAIADRAAEIHPWIRVLHRPPRTARSVGPGVVAAFYAGLGEVDLADFDYVCKLDGDLEVGPNYFALLVRRCVEDPSIGTISGKVYVPHDGRMVQERTGDEFSLGAAKFYRRECFEEIGGFVREVMWDGIDCHRCRMLGWKALSVDDPALDITHFRQMGSSHKSIYHGRRRWGRGQYFMGTHPLYILAIAAYRTAERPYVLGGLSILMGYVMAAIEGRPRYDDLEFRRHLHRWQLANLSRIGGAPFRRIRDWFAPRPQPLQAATATSRPPHIVRQSARQRVSQ